MHRSLCLIVLLVLFYPTQACFAEKPNLIFILSDDQGYGDVSALNPGSKIPTPHIDRIAREGMIFTDAHSSSSVCTPSRYSLLTGRYHWRTRLQSGVLGGYSPPLIAEGRLTLAGFLKEQGYHTACVGKWHLGFYWQLKDGNLADDQGDFGTPYQGGWNVDYRKPIQRGPCDVGFDHFFGISASLDMPPYVFIENKTATEDATVEKAFHRKGPAGVHFEDIDVLPEFTSKALRYIEQRAEDAKKGTPFFLYLPLNAPHTPISPTPEWSGRSGINKYADFTMQVDATVGEVLDALDRHGLAENTLIFFSSDNGCSPAANIPELEKAGHDQNYIYRGHKADLFEGGHRVPFVARWPGKIKGGSVSHQTVGQLDLLATMAEITGATYPDTAGEDSLSFLPALLGKEKGSPREAIVSQSIGGQFAIQTGDWKLLLCPGSGGWSHPRPGSIDLSEFPPIQLYHLAEDPGEEKNLESDHPEKVTELKSLLEKYISEGRSTPGARLENDAPVVMIKPIPQVKKRPGKK